MQIIVAKRTQFLVSLEQALLWDRAILIIAISTNGLSDNDRRQFIYELCHPILNKEVGALLTSSLYGGGYTI